SLDPLLGIFTGFFAYYLYETHPRTAIPEQSRLAPLVSWKWGNYKKQREEHLRSLEGI
ncbi:hypothetical protein BDN72DRAFT_756184, partial [Pluteus cervinus]